MSQEISSNEGARGEDHDAQKGNRIAIFKGKLPHRLLDGAALSKGEAQREEARRSKCQRARVKFSLHNE